MFIQYELNTQINRLFAKRTSKLAFGNAAMFMTGEITGTELPFSTSIC